LLQQEGFPFGVLDLDPPPDPSAWSVLVITRPLKPGEREAVELYLRRGGAVLGTARFCAGVGGTSARPAGLRHISGGEEDGDFASIGILDIEKAGDIPREAQFLRGDDGTHVVQAGELAGGHVVFLPFDPSVSMEDARAAVRQFHARQDRLPWERVALAAKGEVRHLIRLSLQYLHHVRGIPYVHLWYFPDGAPTVLGLRVDTDGASHTDILNQYAVSTAHSVGCSWFVDVGRARDMLRVFRSMEGQEFGAHCYRHEVHTDRARTFEDLRLAKTAMGHAGLAPRGCAAPYGFWSQGFARATKELGFEYSSEFAYAYDTLPFVPHLEDTTEAPLQVPVHPVCPGTLRRIGADEGTIVEYFEERIRTSIARREPLFLYHHPSHRSWRAIGSSIERALERGALPLLLIRYAEWWKERTTLRLDISLEGDILFVAGLTPEKYTSFMLHASHRLKGESTLEGRQRTDLRTLRWEPREPWVPPRDLRRTREFDLRTMVGALHTALLRRRW
jgi:hypothetical protein